MEGAWREAGDKGRRLTTLHASAQLPASFRQGEELWVCGLHVELSCMLSALLANSRHAVTPETVQMALACQRASQSHSTAICHPGLWGAQPPGTSLHGPAASAAGCPAHPTDSLGVVTIGGNLQQCLPASHPGQGPSTAVQQVKAAVAGPRLMPPHSRGSESAGAAGGGWGRRPPTQPVLLWSRVLYSRGAAHATPCMLCTYRIQRAQHPRCHSKLSTKLAPAPFRQRCWQQLSTRHSAAGVA